MVLKIAWAITGAGDYLPEAFEVMKQVTKEFDLKLMVFLSKAGFQVVKWYKLLKELEALDPKYHVETDANTPFLVGPLQRGKYQVIVVMPATANSTAKIAHGIADTLITNAIAQAQKTEVPIYIYPVDQTPGSVTTVLPSGEQLTLITRKIDLENVEKLRQMDGIHVLAHPREFLKILASLAKKLV
jgi:archaeoflavoprotein AfpA